MAAGSDRDINCSKTLQNLSDTIMKDQVGSALHPGLSFINDHQVLAMEKMGQLGSRTDFQRCPAYDQAVGAPDHVNCV